MKIIHMPAEPNLPNLFIKRVHVVTKKVPVIINCFSAPIILINPVHVSREFPKLTHDMQSSF